MHTATVFVWTSVKRFAGTAARSIRVTPPRKNNLEYLYLKGKGGKRDQSKALTVFRAAAEKGLPEAQTNLGQMYASGSGVDKNLGEALRWFGKAADPQNALGLMYERGLGVKRDYSLARIRYQQAADNGDFQAEGNLGYLYLRGEGVRQDYPEGLRHIAKAAELGYGPAQVTLGLMYATGRGSQLSYPQAYKWAKHSHGVWQLRRGKGDETVAANHVASPSSRRREPCLGLVIRAPLNLKGRSLKPRASCA
jgi:TPR repeat protein